MIASINGKVVHIETNSIIVELGGVGLNIYIPAPLRDKLKVGDVVFLHTSLIVRQDLLALYGFESRESKDLFNLLLTVNGIGPRLASSILSILTPDAIRRAIFNEQADVFSRVPGVGKKTAQKILISLQGKIKAMEGLEAVSLLSDVDTEVMAALTALG